jgi:diguanylate cyclase (GGDEF)-like protein/PAS domain S-box-containing protein
MNAERDNELKILILEDVPTDAELIERTLRKAGFRFTAQRADTRESFARALEEFGPDVVLSDYSLPGFDGLTALKIVQEKCPDVPVIEVTGALGDEAAVELVREGAKDYVLKDRLARLPFAVQHALWEAEGARRRREAEEALRRSEEKFRSVAEVAQDAIIMIDSCGRVGLWNPAAERILGYTAGEMIGREVHEWIVPVPFREKMRLGMRDFAATGRGPIVGKTTEFSAIRKDGVEIPVELSVGATQFAGEWRSVATLRDITERKRAERSLNRVNRALRTLSAANETLIRANSERELLDEMCRVVVRAGYRLAWIGYAEKDEAKTVRPLAWAGDHPEFVETANITWANTERGWGPSGAALRTGELQVNQNVGTNPVMAPWRAEMVECGFLSSASLPLKDGSETFGCLTLYAGEADAFEPDEVELLSQLATDLSFGIQTRALHERATRDGLTHLYNHSTYYAILEREIVRAGRAGRPLSVLMVDIDHFKRINDTYGHLVGDRILEGIANALQQSVRGMDSVCRYGGEEFCIILPDADAAAALQVGERLRAAIERNEFILGDGQSAKITVSIGGASLSEQASSSIKLTKAADSALYAAKENGRNCVQFV